MDFKELFEMQRSLDIHIEAKHGLYDVDLFNQKSLALLVEIGELANETRCFKFWSLKPSSEKQIILEEFVDGVHFILSLGLECDYAEEAYGFNFKDDESELQTTDLFLKIYQTIIKFRNSKSKEDFFQLLEQYFALAVSLGFTMEEIVQAYIQKNKVNYERQQKGY